jgi:DNA-binding PadR family transcriptional regulator
MHGYFVQRHQHRFARPEDRMGRHGPHERGAHERGPHERGGRHEGRGGRPGRVFDHGDLRLVVLALIAERPRHGYEIIKEIEDRLGGSYSPSPGVIYPTLTLLEELGHATVEETGGKKLYALTEAGAAWIEANRAAMDAVLARMSEVRANHGGGPAPQLMRAMENLKLALRLRVGRGPLSEAQLRAVTDALDAAAVAIERA